VGGWPGVVDKPGIALKVVGTSTIAASIGLSGWALAAATVSKLRPDAISRLAANCTR